MTEDHVLGDSPESKDKEELSQPVHIVPVFELTDDFLDGLHRGTSPWTSLRPSQENLNLLSH